MKNKFFATICNKFPFFLQQNATNGKVVLIAANYNVENDNPVKAGNNL